MRKIYLSIISIFVMTTISSCMTTSGFLTQRKQATLKKNRTYNPYTFVFHDANITFFKK